MCPFPSATVDVSMPYVAAEQGSSERFGRTNEHSLSPFSFQGLHTGLVYILVVSLPGPSSISFNKQTAAAVRLRTSSNITSSPSLLPLPSAAHSSFHTTPPPPSSRDAKPRLLSSGLEVLCLCLLLRTEPRHVRYQVPRRDAKRRLTCQVCGRS